jgi:hypothetical protein
MQAYEGLLCGGRRKQMDPRTRKFVPHPYPHPFQRHWLTHIFEANLWLALGRTRSQLHYDKENIMLCTVRGAKKFVLIDTRKFYHKIPWVRGGRYKGEDDLLNAGTDWVSIDPDAVDLRVFSMFRDVEYMNVTLGPGDCIFMPYSTLHYVNTHEEEAKTDPHVFQVSYSYFFLPQERYDAEACEAAGLTKPLPPERKLPMAATDILWYYTGKGIIPQGYPDPHLMMNDVARSMQQVGSKYLNTKALNEWLKHGESRLRGKKKRVKEYISRFSQYAKDPSKGLTAEELGWPNTPLELWLELCGEGDPEGGLPCDEGELYDPRTDEEWQRMEAAIDAFLGQSAEKAKHSAEL